MGGVHGVIGVVRCLPVKSRDIARDACEVLQAAFRCHVQAGAGELCDLDLPLPGDPSHLAQGQREGQDKDKVEKGRVRFGTIMIIIKKEQLTK